MANKSSLVINVDAQYAMKSEAERLNRIAPIKEMFC